MEDGISVRPTPPPTTPGGLSIANQSGKGAGGAAVSGLSAALSGITADEARALVINMQAAENKF